MVVQEKGFDAASSQRRTFSLGDYESLRLANDKSQQSDRVASRASSLNLAPGLESAPPLTDTRTTREAHRWLEVGGTSNSPEDFGGQDMSA